MKKRTKESKKKKKNLAEAEAKRDEREREWREGSRRRLRESGALLLFRRGLKMKLHGISICPERYQSQWEPKQAAQALLCREDAIVVMI